MKAALPPIPLLIAALACSACTAREGYPSLAPRAVEAMRFTVAPRAEAPVSTAELGPDVGVQRAAAEDGRALFAQRLAEAQAAVDAARGADIGSEAWVQAQSAISRLDRAIEPASAALATLDRMMIEAAAGPAGVPHPALAEAWEAVGAIAADQRAALETMAGRLPAS